MTLEALNVLRREDAIAEFLRCCGSKRWAAKMTDSRPFSSHQDMANTADTIWAALEPTDWLEAFGAHPRIGSGGSSKRESTKWSRQEQSGMSSADAEVRERLARSNRDYFDRFGYIFIVCATGKSAGEMLAILEERLKNDPSHELRIASEEQRQITRLRLAKLTAE